MEYNCAPYLKIGGTLFMRVKEESNGFPTYVKAGTYSSSKKDTISSTLGGTAPRSGSLDGKTNDSFSRQSKDKPILRHKSTHAMLDSLALFLQAEVNSCSLVLNSDTQAKLEESARQFLKSLDELKESELRTINNLLKTPQIKPATQNLGNHVEGSPRTEQPETGNSHNMIEFGLRNESFEIKSPYNKVKGSLRTDKPETQGTVCEPPVLKRTGCLRTKKPETREAKGRPSSSKVTGGPRTKKPRTQELVQYDENKPLKMRISLKGLKDHEELNLKISSGRGADSPFATDSELHTTPTHVSKATDRHRLQPAPANALSNDDEVEYLETVTAKDLNSFIDSQED